MTQEFNLRPPVNSPLVDDKNMLTPDWQAFFRSLFLFFQNDFNPNTILVPSVSNSELSSLPTSSNGTITYNANTNELQVLKNGTWRTITTS